MKTVEIVRSFVTVELGGHTFAIPIERVREVFVPGRLTRVPLATGEVAGVLNLRGRIVTAIDMRALLGMPPRPAGERAMAIGVDEKSEACALLVDAVGDVMDLPDGMREPTPGTLAPRWSRIVAGVHRLEDRLLLIVDVDRALEPPALAA